MLHMWQGLCTNARVKVTIRDEQVQQLLNSSLPGGSRSSTLFTSSASREGAGVACWDFGTLQTRTSG